MSKICNKCGWENEVGDYCINCGSRLKEKIFEDITSNKQYNVIDNNIDNKNSNITSNENNKENGIKNNNKNSSFEEKGNYIGTMALVLFFMPLLMIQFENEILYLFSYIFPHISIILLIYGKIKYPKNIFITILLILFIVLIIVSIIFIIWFFISCMRAF